MSDVSPSDISNLKKVLTFSDSDRDERGFTPFIVFMPDFLYCNPQKIWVDEKVVVICRALGIATTLCTNDTTSHMG